MGRVVRYIAQVVILPEKPVQVETILELLNCQRFSLSIRVVGS